MVCAVVDRIDADCIDLQFLESVDTLMRMRPCKEIRDALTLQYHVCKCLYWRLGPQGQTNPLGSDQPSIRGLAGRHASPGW